VIANIPADLQELKQWVLWRYIWKVDESTGRAEWAKLPMQANGSAAKSNDPETWTTFKDALNAWDTARSSFDGLGFMFTPESGIVGVDVDNCVDVDEHGELRISNVGARVIELLDSYTELSPSGSGIHVLVKAEFAEALKDSKTGIEVYNKGRYFTVTGSLWADFIPVQDRTAQLRQIVEGIRKAKAAPKNGNGNGHSHHSSVIALTVDDRLKKAFAAQNGQSIARLFHGDTSDYNGDDSSADLALCSKLAFWCENRADVLDSMFRASRLMRDKWDARHNGNGDTYGQMTLSKALAGQIEFYDPQRRPQPSQPAKSKDGQPAPEERYAERKARRFKFGELYERSDAYRKMPSTTGEHPGWDNVAKLYRPRKGLFTIVTGIPSHGKSSWLNALCFNLALMSKWKFLFCSFETQPIEQHACDLARIITGKPSFVAADGAATDEEFKWAFETFPEAFQFAQVPDEDMSVDGVLSYAFDAVRDDGIDGFIFDPWSELNPPSKLVGNYTQFVQQGLNKIRRFTRENNIHTWLVAHPTKFMAKGQKDEVPTLYDIADSAHFYNKADYGIVVHRPSSQTAGVNVHVQKVRFYSTGKKGSCALEYGETNGRYTEKEYSERRTVNEYSY
jgi:hypothetical protein